MKKIIGKIVNIFLVAIIIGAAALMVMVGVNAKNGKATTVLGYGFMVIQTPSMAETYPVGTVVITKAVKDASTLKKDDVITFYQPKLNQNITSVTHRIVKVTNDGDGTYSFITKGDSNLINDEYPALSENVIGKVVATSKVMQKLMTLRENPAFFLVIVVLPMCIIITLELINISKKMNGSSDENGKDNQEKDKQ